MSPFNNTSSATEITVTLLNRQGGGFAEPVILQAGTTVGELLSRKNIDPESVTIRVARAGQNPITPHENDVLQHQDRVSAVPLKVEGAC